MVEHATLLIPGQPDFARLADAALARAYRTWHLAIGWHACRRRDPPSNRLRTSGRRTPLRRSSATRGHGCPPRRGWSAHGRCTSDCPIRRHQQVLHRRPRHPAVRDRRL